MHYKVKSDLEENKEEDWGVLEELGLARMGREGLSVQLASEQSLAGRRQCRAIEEKVSRTGRENV